MNGVPMQLHLQVVVANVQSTSAQRASNWKFDVQYSLVQASCLCLHSTRSSSAPLAELTTSTLQMAHTEL